VDLSYVIVYHTYYAKHLLLLLTIGTFMTTLQVIQIYIYRPENTKY